MARGGRASLGTLALLSCFVWLMSAPVRALGPGDGIEMRRVHAGAAHDEGGPRGRAAERLAWEVRKRTSIETMLTPTNTRFDDASIFRTPLLYWSSDRGFDPLSERELTGLRRFVEYGGFVIIDDAAPETGSFDASVRRDLSRAFPSERLERVPASHTILHSFYLIDGETQLEAVVHSGRAAIVYTRQDLGGLWISEERTESAFGRSDLGSEARERAIRLGVNLVMYALCLDYKDDQVHAPFILRRRAGRP